MLTTSGDWAEPFDPDDPADVEASQRKLEFSIGWYADPIYLGHYPDSMRQQLGDRLPTFTDEELTLVKGSNDFYGMNTYCSNYVRNRDTPPGRDDFVGNLETLFENKDGASIGPMTQSPWLRPHPVGFRRLLNWISKRYSHPSIYVTENGTSITGENDMTIEQILDDKFRVEYFRGYIGAMGDAVSEDGVDVRGYMAWSLMDNFEWAEGFETRFGVCYVDYANGQKRIPKKSAKDVGNFFRSMVKAD